MSRKFLLLSLLTGLALVTLVRPLVASAHASLVWCAPRVGGNVARPPSQIVCQFDQPLYEDKSSLAVLNANGMKVDRGNTHFFEGDEQSLVVSLDTTRMAAGIYTVQWNVVDTLDRGATSGQVQFGVSTVVPPTPTAVLPGVAMTPAASVASGGAGELVSRFLIAAGVVVLAGVGALYWRTRGRGREVESE